MKKIINKSAHLLIITLALLLISTSIFAQAPEKMSYQAVVRDGSNNLVSSTAVGMQVSILQGSSSGTAVYVETQTPTSNANGLVSIEIGSGTPVSGTFATIDWANGPYFIKTENDPTGGTSYTITGTSQLLSVPYALYAKTSGSSTPGPQGPAGADGNGIASTTDNGDGAFTFTYDDGSTFTTSDLTGPQGNTGATGAQGQQGIQGVQGPAGTNGTNGADGNGIASTTDNGDGTFTFTYDDGSTFTTSDLTGPQGPAGTATTYSVGDFAQGGIVFWVDETGQHGLVAAKEDQSTGVRWYAGTNGNTQAKGDGPYAGEANTSIIIAAQVAIGDDGSTYAARICNELQITEGSTTYGDWYLPSREELNLMYQNKATIDATAAANGGSGFASAYYWSSAEYNNYFAWSQTFDYGYRFNYDKYTTNRVRAVRAF